MRLGRTIAPEMAQTSRNIPDSILTGELDFVRLWLPSAEGLLRIPF